jgi:hypothetical protein
VFFTPVLSETNYVQFTVDKELNVAHAYVEGNQIALTGPAAGSLVVAFDTVGRYAVGSMNGEIAEFLIYNRVLSRVERESVENYLRAKWGAP